MAPKTILRLPDLDQAKSAVLNSLTSADAQRGYRHAIDEFVAQRMLHFSARRSALQQRYYEAVKQQLGAKTAVRFLQLESRLIAIEDLQVAAQVPLLR